MQKVSLEEGQTVSIGFYDSLCDLCKHRHGGSRGGRESCDAFPDGIPTEISVMNADHREPYTGDNGVLFELKDESAPDDSALARGYSSGFFDEEEDPKPSYARRL